MLRIRFFAASLLAHAWLLLPFLGASDTTKSVTTAVRFAGTTFDVETEPQPTPDAVSSPSTQPHEEPRVALESKTPALRPEDPPSGPESAVILDTLPSLTPGASETATSVASARPPRAPPAAAAASRRPVRDVAATGTNAPAVQTETQAKQGSYGAEGLPPGVVHLRAAFIKTLPLAAKSDAAWMELPLGSAGSVDVEVRISGEHQLEELAILHRPGVTVSEALQRLVRINKNFLLRGRFAVDTSGQTGSQRLRVRAEISQTAADAERPDAEGVSKLGQIGGTDPSGAYFTYYSGRRVEFQVQELD